MRIVLRRKVNVFQVNVVAKVAFAQTRVAEHAVVVWVAERLAQNQSARIEDLCSADAKGPLVGLAPVVARRMVQVCQELGLLTHDRNREFVLALSEEGRRVAASREPRIFVPQLGTWTLYWSNESLLDHPLLGIEVFREPSSHDEDKARKQARDRGERPPQRQLGEVPKPIAAVRDEQSNRPPLTLPAGGEPIRVMMIEPRAEFGPTTSSALSIEVTFEPNATEGARALRGSLNGKQIEFPLSSIRGQQHERVFGEMLRSIGADTWWNVQTRKLQASFSQLAPHHLTSFLRELKFKTPEIRNLGRFEDTVVDKVPIEPATFEDAQHWFEWLLKYHVQKTQWPEVYEQGAIEIMNRFPGFRLHVPRQDTFAQSVRRDQRPPAAYWRLQAPLDLDGGMNQ
ncbi:MAG TPA: hypothetical protein PK156_38545 [Polyangium sp.]|nr:hypothetical protein [Polyangium sp.]